MTKRTAAYDYRHLRIYDTNAYERFVELCRERGTSATSELNFMIRDVVRKGKIPSNHAVIL